MRTSRLFAVLVAATVLILTGFTGPWAQPQTLLKIAPQTLKVRIGKQTSVELEVEKVTELYGAQLRIRFDPEVLEVIDTDPSQSGVQIEPGPMLSPDFVVQNLADNEAGTIDYALTQLPPSKPSSGDGVIARITFRAKKAAVSQIQFDQFLLANTQGAGIEAVPQHGQILVAGSSTWMLVAIAGVALLLVLGGSIGFAITK
jgi:hypothetical protein